MASSVEIVDQWFRLSREDGMELERKSPELYLYNKSVNPLRMVNDSNKAAFKIRGQIFFGAMGDEGGSHPQPFFNPFVPDHISGKA